MNLDKNHGYKKKASSYFRLPVAKEPSAVFKRQWNAMDPFARHEYLMSHYSKKHATFETLKSETEILKEHHKFIHESEPETWEDQLAYLYYQKLYKEYALCSLQQYKKGRIALRWRSEKEVVAGKGQFICANLVCLEARGLKTWEVPFSYMEEGEKKVVLVKVCLCEECSLKG